MLFFCDISVNKEKPFFIRGCAPSKSICDELTSKEKYRFCETCYIDGCNNAAYESSPTTESFPSGTDESTQTDQSAISCYVCNTAKGEQCEDPFNKDSDFYKACTPTYKACGVLKQSKFPFDSYKINE